VAQARNAGARALALHYSGLGRTRIKFTPTLENLSKQPALFLALFLSVTLLWADDKPWKSKSYQTWDDKDLQYVMTDSPWVQITTIRRTSLPVPEKDVAPPAIIAGGVQQFPNASGATGTNPTATNRASEASWRELRVYVYWDSSRVMHAASAGEAVPHGATKDSQVEKYGGASQDEYEVVLRMADMTPFIRNDEKFFQDKAFLRMRRSKLTLPPSHVLYQGDGNGTVRDAVFFFPKKTSSGLATIASDETEVEFSCKIADSTLRVNFKPRRMVDQFGPDL
jgi:hypothetical protein